MGFKTVPVLDAKTEKKCDIKAFEFRNMGNHEYNKKWFDAFTTLRYYNKSIAYAKSKEVTALGYANRSATYFEKGMYKECLENIQLARENNYPADKMVKLDEREEKCKKLMGKNEENPNENPWIVFELSYPANKRIPFIVDCVEVKKTSDGHGIFATRNLKPGDVISVEESVCYFLRGESYYERCFNCYKPNSLNLIPCDKTASIMFCSKECKESTYKKTLKMENILCDDMKLFSELVAAYESRDHFVDRFFAMSTIKALLDNRHTIFDYDLSNPESLGFKENIFPCLLSIIHYENFEMCKDHYYELFKKCSDRIFMHIAECIVNVLISSNRLEPFVSNIHQGKRDLEYSQNNACDPSIPLFCGLINRARAGNVFSVLPGNKIVVIVMKPIKKGRQLFFSNNNHFELLGYGNNFDYMNQGILDFSWQELTDYTEAKKYLAEEWEFIKSGCKTPAIDCYPTQSIEALRGIAALCSFPMNN